MSTPFLGEIRLMSFNYPPKGWALCNGQQLPIQQNAALFSLLGTSYGGNGVTTFALPDYRGRVPIHAGAGYVIGEPGGTITHTVTVNQLPPHIHPASGSGNNGDSVVPTGNLLGGVTNGYGPATNLTSLIPATVGNAGGSQPHENRQPFLTVSFCIALQGIYPSRN